MEKIEALAELLGVDESEITQGNGYDENVFEVSDGREYFVLTEDEADDMFHDSEMSLIDDIGIEGFTPSFQSRILAEFTDEDWFEDAYREMYESYSYDIEYESDDVYGNRLVQECYEAELIDEDDFGVDENGDTNYEDCLLSTDDLVDKLTEYLMDSVDDFVEQYKFEFGEEQLSEVVNKYNLVDWDAVIEETKELDGRGPMLAGYDGIEIDYDDYYIYRTN
jgi:hypothetical protein